MEEQTARPLRFSSRAKFVTVLSIVVITLYLLGQVFHILIPFIWAIITAYIFNPVVTFATKRTGTKRFWWVTLLYILGFGLIFLLGSFVAPLLATQYTELRNALPLWVDDIQARMSGMESITIGSYEILNLRELETTLIAYLNEQITVLPTTVPGFLFGVIEGFILTLVYLVVTFYLLLQADTLPTSFYNLIPAPHRAEIRQLVGSIDRVLGAYIWGQFLLIIIMSVLSFIALSILDVKFALVISIATGVLEIIPIVGPYMATAIAATVAFFQGTTPFGWEPWTLAVVVIIVYFALRQFEDHFIIPNLVGHIVNVHPVLVIFAILAGGSLAGALGLLIAIPIAAVLKIILIYLYTKLVDDPNPSNEIDDTTSELLGPKAATAQPLLNHEGGIVGRKSRRAKTKTLSNQSSQSDS